MTKHYSILYIFCIKRLAFDDFDKGVLQGHDPVYKVKTMHTAVNDEKAILAVLINKSFNLFKYRKTVFMPFPPHFQIMYNYNTVRRDILQKKRHVTGKRNLPL